MNFFQLQPMLVLAKATHAVLVVTALMGLIHIRATVNLVTQECNVRKVSFTKCSIFCTFIHCKCFTHCVQMLHTFCANASHNLYDGTTFRQDHYCLKEKGDLACRTPLGSKLILLLCFICCCISDEIPI